MNLLAIIQEAGLQPKHTSSTHGGEYHSPCPACGGRDRFIIWPALGRYWCRQCKKSGDAIQFSREFTGISFREVYHRAHGEMDNHTLPPSTPSQEFFSPESWITKGAEFVESCHQRLLLNTIALQLVNQRGLSMETIKKQRLGWNPVNSFRKREEWGLEKKIIEGKEKRLFLPKGLVIPAFRDGQLHKIKIRKAEWREDDHYGKYYEVPGSSERMYILGSPDLPTVMIVEAELDAMLVAQEAKDICCSLALGGAQKRPNSTTHQWLNSKKLILLSLDFDEAGKKEYHYWRSTYPHLLPWPTPVEKSPADAWSVGVNLKQWVLAGLKP